MIDSYNSYLSRSVQAQMTLKKCQDKIAYFLQVDIFAFLSKINNIILNLDSC